MVASRRRVRVRADLPGILVALACATGVAVAKPGTHGHAVRSFAISGSASRPMSPGHAVALNLRLTNRRKFPVLIRQVRISLSVDARHRRAGCSVRRDFAVRQLPRRLPARAVPARSRRTLRRLGVRRLPRLVMPNLRRNQNACKGARLKLSFRGRAVRARRTKRG